MERLLSLFGARNDTSVITLVRHGPRLDVADNRPEQRDTGASTACAPEAGTNAGSTTAFHRLSTSDDVTAPTADTTTDLNADSGTNQAFADGPVQDEAAYSGNIAGSVPSQALVPNDSVLSLWRDLRPWDTPLADTKAVIECAWDMKDQQKKTIDVVVSSPFTRCLQTAALIAAYIGKTEIFVDWRLGEDMMAVRRITKWKEESNINARYYLSLLDMQRCVNDILKQHAKTERKQVLVRIDDLSHTPPFNEPFPQLCRRTASALVRLTHKYPSQHILAVTHASHMATAVDLCKSSAMLMQADDCAQMELAVSVRRDRKAKAREQLDRSTSDSQLPFVVGGSDSSQRHGSSDSSVLTSQGSSDTQAQASDSRSAVCECGRRPSSNGVCVCGRTAQGLSVQGRLHPYVVEEGELETLSVKMTATHGIRLVDQQSASLPS